MLLEQSENTFLAWQAKFKEQIGTRAKQFIALMQTRHEQETTTLASENDSVNAALSTLTDKVCKFAAHHTKGLISSQMTDGTGGGASF